MTSHRFPTTELPDEYDYLAPDGSEIRPLLEVDGASLAHCTLPSRRVSEAHKHKTVDEIWYFLAGEGAVWRKGGVHEEVTDVFGQVALTIPAGVHFQFRNTGDGPLRFIIVTVPPWPGADEAVSVPNCWDPGTGSSSRD